MTGIPSPIVTIPTQLSGTVNVAAVNVTSTPVQLLQGVARRSYLRIFNLSAAGTLWVSKLLAAPAPNLAGCYPIPAGSYEEFLAPPLVPTNPIYAVSDGGTIACTVENYDA